MLFSVTYEIITEESAEHGEAEETGFTMEDVTLREAWDFLRWEGYCEASDSTVGAARWITFYGEQCPMTGNHTNYSLHFTSKLSQYSRARIARLFRCYGVK
jgi:hypothetical protein